MAVKMFAIMALTGAVFAHMDPNGTNMPEFTIPVANKYTESAIAVTSPPMTTINATLATTLSPSSNSSYNSTTPASNYSSVTITAVVSSSVTTSSLVVTMTDTVGMPSETTANYTTGTQTMGAGGSITSKPSTSASTSAIATTTSKPVSDDGVVNRISIGLFLVSVTLTVLFQM